MPIEQTNISLSPQMVRFIRGKVKNGDYTDASEVVRRLQADEAAKTERRLLADFEVRLPQSEHDDIHRSVRRGIKDIEAGRFEEYDADGLRGVGRELVARSLKNRLHAQRRSELSFKLARSARRDLQEIADFWTAEAGGKVSRRVGYSCG
jgi:putative addiction module CopG family antidote